MRMEGKTMISKVNSMAVRNAYQNGDNQQKVEKKGAGSVSSQGDTSNVEQIKASIEKGEYQINLEALADKIADELM